MAKNLLKVGRKKTVRRSPKSFDEKYLGPEPTWTDSLATNTQIASAYNWYNYFYDKKESVKSLFNYYPRNKKELRFIKRIDVNSISSVLGYQARMISRGCKFPKEDLERFYAKIDDLILLGKSIKEEKLESKPTNVISIQDRVKEKISELIGEMEGKVDEFVETYKSDFNSYTWLQSNNVKGAQAIAIARYYQPLLDELIELKSGKDSQLNEGYKDLSKKQVDAYIQFVKNIVDDCTTWGSNQKTVRKTRTKKPISLEKQIKNIKYLKEYKDYKIVSINPADIIGTNQLWVFNVKYRVLTRYDAMGPSGLSIKGTTLQGYDVDTSVSKTVRKPELILPKVLSGGVRVLKKIMEEINSKEQSPNGRINSDTVLLKAIK